MTIDKQQVWQRLCAQVSEELERATQTQRGVQSGVTHAEARPENDKDTRAIEASYLARGLAGRVDALQQAVLALERVALRDFMADSPIALGALVGLEEVESGASQTYLVAPAAGGMRLEVEGVVVRVVTPEAPLGRALLGSHLGDEVRVPAPQGAREMEIISIA